MTSKSARTQSIVLAPVAILLLVMLGGCFAQAPDGAPPAAPYTFQMEPSNLTIPTSVLPYQDGWLVGQLDGFIVKVTPGATTPEPFLNLSASVKFSPPAEQGLFSFVLHEGAIIVAYAAPWPEAPVSHVRVGYDEVGPAVDLQGCIFRVERMERGNGTEPTNRTILFETTSAGPHHTGGSLRLDAAGDLFFYKGDSRPSTGTELDVIDNAQNLSARDGKVYRLRGPAFAGPPEIIALGVRNPWSMSVDDVNRELWVADVGGSRWEEANRIQLEGPLPVNLGWPAMEGPAPRPDKWPANESMVPPYAGFSHADGHCAVIGGFVYRASDLPAFARGRFLFGDLCLKQVFALNRETPRWRLVAELPEMISFIGPDRDGEPLVLTYEGHLFHGPA